MNLQTTLLTSHKGVDLHAATALRVMQERLDGGHALKALFRCEMHTFCSGDHNLSMERLLSAGRYFNPNKHHFGHFEGEKVSGIFNSSEISDARALPTDWPRTVKGSDLEMPPDALYDALLGGPVQTDLTAVDLVSFSLGQDSPLVSGVLWRLILQANQGSARDIGESLAVARSRKEGLLINPHMEAWLTAVR